MVCTVEVDWPTAQHVPQGYRTVTGQTTLGDCIYILKDSTAGSPETTITHRTLVLTSLLLSLDMPLGKLSRSMFLDDFDVGILSVGLA